MIKNFGYRERIKPSYEKRLLQKGGRPQILGRTVPTRLLRQWYHKENKSAEQIKTIILNKYGVEITREAISRFVKEKFGTRSHKDAMRMRVIKGQVDYEKIRNKTDYLNRNIDYKEVALKRSFDYTGPLKHPKQKNVYLPQPYIERIKQFAKNNNKTITDVLKEILGKTANLYKIFHLCKIENSFRPYSYKKRYLMDQLDKYFSTDKKSEIEEKIESLRNISLQGASE